MNLSEMLFLGLLGLVMFGPTKVAAIGQQAGQMIARLKKMSSEFQSQLAMEITSTPDNLTSK